jgi:prepilin-type N-terminal cleavage/methylation domain-containing protein
MTQRFSRLQGGFTLIELLVVIAIIGILSSVVLASLNTARGKGSDAAIQSNLSNIRAQAEIYYDGNSNNYNLVCADTNVAAQLASAANASGATLTVTDATAQTSAIATCHDNASAWAASVPLKTDSSKQWCVDSTGVSAKRNSVLAASAMVCPAS